MKTRVLIALAIVAVAAPISSQAGTAATPKTKLCGQIKHGPRTTYTMMINNKKITGTTWTVFATGAPCSKAMTEARPILKWWKTAKVGASDYSAHGFGCNKEADRKGRSGSVGCSYAGGPSGANIELMMTGKYTIAQLKKMFFIH